MEVTSSPRNSITQKGLSTINLDYQMFGDKKKVDETRGFLEHKKFSDFYSKILENNQKWKETCLANDQNYFINLAKPQEPKCLVISCSDSRVVVNDCLGLKSGEMFSHRNVGNMSLQLILTSKVLYNMQLRYSKLNI